jgi:hypothetical protein
MTIGMHCDPTQPHAADHGSGDIEKSEDVEERPNDAIAN